MSAPLPDMDNFHAIDLGCRQWWVAPNLAIIRGFLDEMMVIMYEACVEVYRNEHGLLDSMLPVEPLYRPLQSSAWFDVNERPDIVHAGVLEVQRGLESLPAYREAKEGDAYAEIKRVLDELETVSSAGVKLTKRKSPPDPALP